ncbi:MAG TPA: serine/threonine-protein kinase, partial [Kofleriaceae bacterium]|nr:serine/threonine-protein kinase [Kofleriaceae bacterium]
MVRHVASGGMAEIYLATYDDRGTPREAVVKVILRERARDRKFVQMFLDEARVSSTFNHPNIAQLYEVGRDGDTYFYAMEYVAGDNVRALIERSLRARVPMPLAVTLAIGTRVAAALHYAHDKASATGQALNAVHRDVTPSNIMLGFDGAVKLLDFGIARADTRAAMTQSGTVKGKFAYMSPEQCKGLQVDRRTDVFALGIVLYELSVQRRAFRAETDFDTMERIIRGDLIPPHRIHPDYPRELEAILAKALATDPAERYQTAGELAQALAAFQQAQGLPADEAPVEAIMRQLFAAEAPPEAPSIEVVEPPPPRSAPPPMSLASMLAATVEPVAAVPGAGGPGEPAPMAAGP